MTPVEERLRRRIAITGPITIADYMAACLTDPDGYYATVEPFGGEGDFVTAPEISQIFGEIVGAWLLHRWHGDGSPAPVDLVELGPGRGTLMADVLRVAQRDPRFAGASRVVLVEASDRLKGLQRERVAPLHPRVAWMDAAPSERPLYLVANEFFDALPIRQFVRKEGRWFERTIGLAENRLSFGLSPFPAPIVADAPEGAVREVRPAADAVMGSICAAIKAHGAGCALIIDYGYEKVLGGETFQAVRQHKSVGVLEAPGTVDLSAHVDFSALRKVAEASGVFAHGPVGQGPFLLALGLLERAGQLGAGASAETQAALQAAVNRLAGEGEGQMGCLFKVMAITPTPEAPPGF